MGLHQRWSLFQKTSLVLLLSSAGVNAWGLDLLHFFTGCSCDPLSLLLFSRCSMATLVVVVNL